MGKESDSASQLHSEEHHFRQSIRACMAIVKERPLDALRGIGRLAEDHKELTAGTAAATLAVCGLVAVVYHWSRKRSGMESADIDTLARDFMDENADPVATTLLAPMEVAHVMGGEEKLESAIYEVQEDLGEEGRNEDSAIRRRILDPIEDIIRFSLRRNRRE